MNHDELLNEFQYLIKTSREKEKQTSPAAMSPSVGHEAFGADRNAGACGTDGARSALDE